MAIASRTRIWRAAAALSIAALVVVVGGRLVLERERVHIATRSPKITTARIARAVAAAGRLAVPTPASLAYRVAVELADVHVDATESERAPNATAQPWWRDADGPPPNLAGLANGAISNPKHVRVEPAAMLDLQVGSLVPIDLPDGQHFVARVQSMSAHENGDRSWSGHLDGYDALYPVNFTQGDLAAFGTIATPGGLYSLEAIANDGVLYRDQRESLQDPTKDCELIPD